MALTGHVLNRRRPSSNRTPREMVLRALRPLLRSQGALRTLLRIQGAALPLLLAARRSGSWFGLRTGGESSPPTSIQDGVRFPLIPLLGRAPSSSTETEHATDASSRATARLTAAIPSPASAAGRLATGRDSAPIPSRQSPLHLRPSLLRVARRRLLRLLQHLQQIDLSWLCVGLLSCSERETGVSAVMTPCCHPPNSCSV